MLGSVVWFSAVRIGRQLP